MHLVTVEIFPALPYNWTASEVEPSVRHATYLQRLKLKFDCSHCRRGKTRWTSMKGTAEFKIWRKGRQNFILCYTYEQQHKRCSTWEAGEVYQEEFEDLVLAVVEKFSNPDNSRDRKHQPGKPTKDHDSDRCEACAAGKCNGKESV